MRSFDPRYSPRYRPSRSRSSTVLGAVGSLVRGRGLVVALLGFLVVLLVIAGTRGDDGPSDADAIRSGVDGALARAGYDAVETAVNGQRVTLTGQVPTDADVFAAGQVALSVEDAVDIDNQLTAAGAPPVDDVIDPGEATDLEITIQHQLTRVATLDPIRFDTGSIDIVPESLATLAEVAGILNQNPSLRVEIRGYTDSDGDPAENLARSQSRADAVLAALAGLQVDGTRLVALGYGDADPIAPNETQEGKERNRRIEFRILTGDAPVSPVTPTTTTTAAASTAPAATVPSG